MFTCFSVHTQQRSPAAPSIEPLSVQQIASLTLTELTLGPQTKPLQPWCGLLTQKGAELKCSQMTPRPQSQLLLQ